jgi:hypothetical protein
MGAHGKALRGALALLLATAVYAVAPASSLGQTIEAPYDDDYSFADIGGPAGVPGPLGGLTVMAGDANTLLIGGAANTEDGAIYSIDVTRDGDGHITGFTGAASLVSDAPFIDGGLAYGPGGVLFFTQYPSNGVGQLEPGSSTPDRLIDLFALGVEGSVGALQFVPTGFPGAGSLKLATFDTNNWYDAAVSPDGSGTYDITGVTETADVSGGPEGIVYIAAGSPEFADDSMLVSQYSANKVVAYEIDADGDPVVASAQDFMTDLSGAEGATIDPVTGDFLFSTFGGGDRVIVVQGFVAPPRDEVTGTGTIANNNEFDFDASSDPDGSNAAGTISFHDTVRDTTIAGDVVCLNVDGNRATIVYEDTTPPSNPAGTVGGIIRAYDGAIGDSQKNGRLARRLVEQYRANRSPHPGTNTLNPILTGDIAITDVP